MRPVVAQAVTSYEVAHRRGCETAVCDYLDDMLAMCDEMKVESNACNVFAILCRVVFMRVFACV